MRGTFVLIDASVPGSIPGYSGINGLAFFSEEKIMKMVFSEEEKLPKYFISLSW